MQINNLKITKVLETVSGTSKKGTDWKKVVFVGETKEEYNNLYAFEIFQSGDKDKVDNFLKYNKEGSIVNVDFNVSTREHEGRYYTSLSAWKISKYEEAPTGQTDQGNSPEEDNLPF
jgi:hypothetical protein